MKSHSFSPSFSPTLRSIHRSGNYSVVVKRVDLSTVKGRTRRLQHILLGMSLLLILCWTIGSIWLISVRQGERSHAEQMERRGAIVRCSPEELAENR